MRASIVAAGICALGVSSVASADVVTYVFRPQANPAVPIGSITFDDPAITADAAWSVILPVPLPGSLVAGFSFDFSSIGGPSLTLADITAGSSISSVFSVDGSEIDGSGDPDDIRIVTPSSAQAWFSMDSGPAADYAYWKPLPSTWIQGDWVLLPAPGAASVMALAGVIGLRRRR